MSAAPAIVPAVAAALGDAPATAALSAPGASPLQTAGDVPLARRAARVLGLGAASFAGAGAAAAGYRWYVRRAVPPGLATLVGVSVVAFYLSTARLLGATIVGRADVLALGTVAFNSAALAAAALAAPLGRRAGDRVAAGAFAVSGAREIDAEVGRLVRTVGRVTPATLPDEIEDVDGYDPVDPAVKERLAGTTLLFPRRLTVAELRDRLVARLAEDYAVGHVDVDIREDGTVEYLGVGSRIAGVGPTLAPGTVAVAVRADPASDAGPGDAVQVWRVEGEDPTRVTTGELRAVDAESDVATVAVDADDAEALAADARHRLLTLPSEPRADRALAPVLRAAEETVATLTVADGGLAGTPVADLPGVVVAVAAPDGAVDAVPAGERKLAAGETVTVLARPEAIRRVESANRSGDAAVTA